mgnify:CR=1 FL=1
MLRRAKAFARGLDEFYKAPYRREFARAAREEHMRAVAAFPLTSGQVSVGALNMYAREPITLDDEERRCLAALASRVGDAVSATYALIDARELVGQLGENGIMVAPWANRMHRVRRSGADLEISEHGGYRFVPLIHTRFRPA